MRRAIQWLCSIFFPMVHQAGYLRGRLDGWQACERSVIERAEKCGYDRNRILKDLLQ